MNITKVGWIGLGKLGLPCALTVEALAEGTVQVVGCDLDPRVGEAVAARSAPWTREPGVDKALETTELRMVDSIRAVIEHTDGLVFTAVQTPHEAAYGGEAPMPEEPRDFDYAALRAVAAEVNAAAEDARRTVILVVISTALPGTMRQQVAPLLGDRVKLIYNPFFPAMGSAMRDFAEPEFVLLGGDDTIARGDVEHFYRRLYADAPVPILTMPVEEAELVKVAYNTFISLKIVYANALQELCDTLNLDVDTVTDALGYAHRRLISDAYLRGGVGDGGACHPRDSCAMSYLAEATDSSVDIWRWVTRAREAQSQWLADLVDRESIRHALPVVVLGKAYKAESELTAGSPAALLVHQLRAQGVEVVEWWDPYVDGGSGPFDRIALFVVMTAHEAFADARYLPRSRVIDPFRYVHSREGMTVRRIGERRGRVIDKAGRLPRGTR